MSARARTKAERDGDCDDPRADAPSERHRRATSSGLRRSSPTGGARSLRLAELVYAAAERLPGAAADPRGDRRRARAAAEGQGRASRSTRASSSPTCSPTRAPGRHLMHAMSQPTAGGARARSTRFRATGSVDLGPIRVDRDGDVGHVTIQNHAFLNSEDDASIAALETAVDLVLLDDAHRRRRAARRRPRRTRSTPAGASSAPASTSPTSTTGKISLVEFMLERELGARQQDVSRPRPRRARRRGARGPAREAVGSPRSRRFAIGGACQLLLVMDRVIAEAGLVLQPARPQGGHHPRLREPAPAALRRRARDAPGDLLQPRRSRPTAPRAGCSPTRSCRGRRSTRAIAHAATELMSAGDDEPRRQPPAAARRRRSRSTCSAAT